jgi:hypothetical protein
LFQFGDGLQGEAGIAAQTIQAIDDQLIKAVEAGIGEDASTGGAGVERHRTGNAIVGVDGANGKPVKGAVAIGELALGGDGLAFALFLGGNAEETAN